MMELKSNIPTEDQISEWKKEFGTIHIFICSDGRKCVVYDPISHFKVFKGFSRAIESDSTLYKSTAFLLEKCWLYGDESIKRDSKCIKEVIEQVEQVGFIPFCQIVRENNLYRLSCGFVGLTVRLPKESDFATAKRLNNKNEPFETNVHLLKSIAIHLERLEEIRKSHPMEYVGMLVGVHKLLGNK